MPSQVAEREKQSRNVTKNDQADHDDVGYCIEESNFGELHPLCFRTAARICAFLHYMQADP
jgi:hypothetical protein